ncbi:MAG: hypothetical protein OQL19_05225 [Gammaproteobacteria bacterium]|nr:hypothetical protein [Gammaproteobacteria bacterium]
MLKTETISNYPINRINESFQQKWGDIAKATESRTTRNAVIKVLSILNAFCDITHTEINLITLNNQNTYQSFQKAFIGFLYKEFDISKRNQYNLVRYALNAFSSLSEHLNVNTINLQLSAKQLSEDVKESIKTYETNYSVNQERMTFYEGWSVANKEDSPHWLNLIEFYNSYGIDFTTQTHNAFKKMAIKEAKITLVNKITLFNSLRMSFLHLFPKLDDFKAAMRADIQHKTMLFVYNLQLMQAQSNKHDLKSFHKQWREKITVFEEIFVKHKLVPKPLIDLPAPEFKTSTKGKSKTRIDKIDQDGNAFNDKLITRVPLSYSDDEAKEAIFESIILDIKHVVYHCKTLVEETMLRYERCQELKTAGKVKKNLGPGINNSFDMSLDKNVCATFYYYGFQSSVSNYYLQFLGHTDKSEKLNNLLCLPKSYLLYPFLYLLVEQHPAITDSWLLNWKLFDKNGRRTGFKQVNNVWVAVSFKKRKGKQKAQQTITLNETSKKLIEQIIDLTAYARDYLKTQGDDNYRSMLISVRGVNSKPTAINQIEKLNRSDVNIALSKTMIQQSPYRDKDYASNIINSLSITTMRASCGVRVYLETNSVHKMAEALGHEEYKPQLINHYLPKPLWDYFTNRWVRLFQNAIVYEAMKDSPYLFDAMDINEDELEQFLANHRLKDIPDIMRRAKQRSQQIENDFDFNEAALLVSPLLLQVFFTVVNLVEANEKITDVAQQFYTTAKFVLTHIQLAIEKDKNRPELTVGNDIMAMYQFAKDNPLDKSILEGAILC